MDTSDIKLLLLRIFTASVDYEHNPTHTTPDLTGKYRGRQTGIARALSLAMLLERR